MKRNLLLFFSLTYAVLIAQPCNYKVGIEEIDFLITKGSFDVALQKIDELKKCTSITDSIEVAINIAEYKSYRNQYKFRRAESAILNAKNLLEKKNNELPFELHFLLAENYGFVPNPELYQKFIARIEDTVLTTSNANKYLLGRYYLTTYRTTNKNAELSLAINHLLAALQAFEILQEPPIFYYGNTLRCLGNMYRNAGDFDKSIFYYNKGKAFISEYYPMHHYEIAYYNYTLGAVYYEKLEYQDALDHFLQAHKVWKNLLAPDSRYMRFLNEAIGDMYWELDDPKNALIYFDKSIVFEEAINNDVSENSIKTADSLINTGNYADALEYYKEAYAWREKEFGKTSVQTGACKNFVARAIHHSGDTEAALNAYQEAINILVPDFQENSWFMNPSADMNIQSYQYLQESMIAKGQLLKELYNKTKDINHLKAAMLAHEFAITLLEDLRNNQLSEESRGFWTQRTLNLIESSIDTAMKLYVNTQDVENLHKAFNFSERSKALLLLASLYDHEISSFANVSEEIISEEIALKKKINDYTGKIETEEKRCADVRGKMLSLWKTEINSLQSEYDLLVERIQREYPDYYQLKYQIQIPEVSAFQNQLLNHQTLISYFTGARNTYVFQLSKDNISIRTIENTEDLLEQVDGFFQHISSLEQLQKSPQLVYDVFTKDGFELYKKLLQPELASEDFNELIIIPDGKLCYLPFETLLTNFVSSQPRNYSTLPYLLNDYSISYGPSAAIQFLAKNNVKTYDSYAGFAPNYEGQEYKETPHSFTRLSNLKYNLLEVDAASKLFKGVKWTGNNVTEDLLKNNSNKAGIIHLAMHGAIEDKHPLLSKLYFNTSDKDDGMLHIYEIYNMDLAAQLVILSACNTAAGKLVRGEGIVSLERAFQYAGSKALLSTLWNVDDAASSQLTELFLKNLKDGKPKNVALQEAKLNFLAAAPPEKMSPFYWSSFKLTGNTQPLVTKSYEKLVFFILSVIVVIFGIIFFRTKRKRAAA